MLAAGIYTLLSLLTNYRNSQSPLQSQSSPSLPSSLTFTLRHLHAVSNTSAIIFQDVPSSYNALSTNAHNVKAHPTLVHRPSSQAHFHRARLRSLRQGQSEKLDWEEDEVLGPDIENRETLRELAKMTNNAYVGPSDPGWYNLTDQWRNETEPFGWEPDADGFRGHVFVSLDNSTVVLSIKGTSAAFIGGAGPTVKKDKLNDNLLFSCCCARVDWTWSTVCDCYSGVGKCDQTCLEESMRDKSLFYAVGTNLYNNVTYLYPNANIWLTGHSLGGSLAALLGVTFGAPVVAFEAPGEKMASKRLHLPSPPSMQHVTHLYHTADVIAMGACNGVLSTCAIGGYAMESRCHNGKTILYDTVSKLHWGVDIRTHRIGVIIDQLLAEDWEEGVPVPKAEPEDDCIDCYSWEYGDFKNVTRTV
ncbi:putative lipase atg15 [Tulasnella sp. 330]|nr:putative lipase atg15 [Tulasnella sp. 330]KAG8885968.1 putative lipase atg15 [Tulasnella sp. 331]KAG8888819.1 putative lipase atg15 [Tulasnella sp. 332]